MSKRNVSYVEPASYFTEEMLKVAEEYDRKNEAKVELTEFTGNFDKILIPWYKREENQ